MSKLIKDVLFLIFKELWDDRTSLYSCLLVNKIWCKIVIPILWKDPWKHLKKRKEKLLLNVIISHLSDESKDNITQGIDFLTNSYQRPLFDYISLCKRLNLNEIKRIIDTIYTKRTKSKIPIITNEILNLFINENTKFTHLYLPPQFDYQINLVPGVETCFSELEYLYCSTITNDSALAGLAEVCKSIKELELSVTNTSFDYGVVRLIEAQTRLNNVHLRFDHSSNESSCKILENSLIKHANTIQYFKINKKPVTKILSSFNNLKILEMGEAFHATEWDHVVNSSLPFLQILRVRNIPIKNITSLIGNTKGHLTEIKVDISTYNEFDHRFIHATDNRKLIKAIYQNCPNLKYLKINFRNDDVLELEQLLIKCQFLDGLYIYFDYFDYFDYFNYEEENFREVDCDKLFSVLTNSSPVNLFKFKFQYNWKIKLTSFKLFFNSWKGRRPMLLQTVKMLGLTNDYFNLIENYEFLGIIKNYYNDEKGSSFEDFEWVNPNI